MVSFKMPLMNASSFINACPMPNKPGMLVDADNNVWVGGYPFVLRMFYKLDGTPEPFSNRSMPRNLAAAAMAVLSMGMGFMVSRRSVVAL